jgi:hypothetical protein
MMPERKIGDLSGGKDAGRDYGLGVRFLHGVEGLFDLPTDTKVSTTPSSNRLAFTVDGICSSHPIESDMRNGTIHGLGMTGQWHLPIPPAALLASKAHPTDADIDDAMSGNICRCGTYVRIREAIKQAAQSSGQGDRQ